MAAEVGGLTRSIDCLQRRTAARRLTGCPSLFVIEHQALGIDERIDPICFVPRPCYPLPELAVRPNAAVLVRRLRFDSSNVGANRHDRISLSPGVPSRWARARCARYSLRDGLRELGLEASGRIVAFRPVRCANACLARPAP